MRRRRSRFLLASFATALVVAALAAAFVLRPLEPPRLPFDFTVKSGASLKSVSRQLSEEGLLAEPYGLWLLARALGRASQLQAGTYRLERPVSPLELLEKLASGDVLPVEVAFVEGTTFRQWLVTLAKNPNVKQTLAGKSDAEIRAALGVEETALEGLFFPDTYRFVAGTPDVEILKRAHAAMKKRLAQSWEGRAPDLPIATAYEALILASIIEKETGQRGERPVIASVFVNRLRLGMRLQTDPTVIYGLGTGFDGNLRKRDLVTDTAFNTYTRDGLPPTPIAMPGAASIEAALHPESTPFLYFVGRGDGTHQFSRSLEEHNRAVASYQLGKR
ncbi:MAG: endolytic transglycosylase MltG [Betaproteobacteria bacterium]|nr:endolytic transglycosylase MltG [Betaproteobacteria bacterium]